MFGVTKVMSIAQALSWMPPSYHMHMIKLFPIVNSTYLRAWCINILNKQLGNHAYSSSKPLASIYNHFCNSMGDERVNTMSKFNIPNSRSEKNGFM